MKPLRKRTAMLLVSVMMIAALTGTALAADSTVTYDGNANQFVFLPGADLFQNFKGVMPGDTLTQNIKVKNDTAKGVKVKLYLRAEPVEEQYRSMLSQMTLKVVQDGSSILFASAADQQGGLASNTCLGTFYSGADINLKVSLAVPVTIGNELQGRTGLIRWVFIAEEYPIEESDPKTGDTSNIWLYGSLFTAGMAGLAVTLLLMRQKRAARDKEKTSM